MLAGVAFGRKSVTRRPEDRRAEPGDGGGAAKGVYSVGAVALTGRWKKRRVRPFGGEAIAAVGRRGGGETRRSAFLRRPRCLSTLPDERYAAPQRASSSWLETAPAPHSASFGERLLYGG